MPNFKREDEETSLPAVRQRPRRNDVVTSANQDTKSEPGIQDENISVLQKKRNQIKVSKTKTSSH